jgi:hypothetical protein
MDYSARTWNGPSFGIDFVDANHGWIWRGVVLSHTQDGGASWADVLNPCGSRDAGLVSFIDRSNGWAACGGIPATFQQRKALQQTSDGGQTWNLISEGTLLSEHPRVAGQMPWDGHVLPLRSSLAFADDQHGWLGTSRGGLFVTATGGQSWAHRQVAVCGEEFIRSVQLLAPGKGLVLWEYGATEVLYVSRDDGLTWTIIYPPP